MAGSELPVEGDAAETETVSIVRYPNRRLYDRSQRRYVTLQEIALMVREGKAVNVRDSNTGDDLTRTILTQIILDHHPERMELLPVPILHLMIRSNGVVLGLLREYFRQSLSYLEFWQRASAFNPMAASMEWLKSIVPIPPAGGARSGAADAEVLAQRLAEMERRLNALDAASAKSDDGIAEGRPGTTGRKARRRPGQVRNHPQDKD
jgi:polyhydroxyalkanoate synthesis repressor PhaR